MAQFAQKNAVIYGVSFDTADENKAFAEKFSFNFPLLCDTGRELGMAYGACNEPTAGYANRIGIVIDENGKVLHYDAKVSPASYPQEVLSRL